MMRSLAGSPSAAARDAEINGQPPRIGPLPDDRLTDEARELCKQMRAMFGIPEDGAMPEVVATMLRHPGLYDAQMKIGIQLAGKGVLSHRERELAVLRQAWLIGAPYEWGEHVDISRRIGVSADEIEMVITGPSAPGWSRHEKALLTAVDELVATYMISDETWAILAESWDEPKLMELPVLVGSYISTAMQQNALRVRLNSNNPGLSHR